jgi:hypothetical protein
MSLQRSWPLICLLMLLALAYGPTVMAGGLLATGDGLGYYLPVRAIAAASYLHGEWPFWNPFNFSGLPLLAAFQGGVLFPGNAPFLLLAPQAAMNASVLMGYFVAGLATYAYARALALPRPAAFLAGASFMGGGYMVAHLEHLTMLHGAGLLSAMLWAIERHATTGRVGYLLGLATFVCLQVFAGYPQTVIVSLLLVGAYALWRHGLAWRALLGVGFALVLGLGLAAIQLVPAAALLAASPRAAMGYAELVANALPPRQVASLLFPFLFGAEPSGLFPTPYWGAGPWQNELSGYMGLLPLMLALIALTAWRERAVVRFWAGAGAVSLLLALGSATPLYWLWARVPVLKIVRVPGRHLLEVDLAIAMLAGLGLAWLMAAEPVQRKRLAWMGGGGVALGVGLGFLTVTLMGASVARHLQPLMPANIDLASALAWQNPAVWLPVIVSACGLGALLALAARPGVWTQGLVIAVALVDLGMYGQCQGWRQLAPHPLAPLRLPGVPEVGGRTLAIDATGYPFHDFARMQALGYPQLGALWGIRAVGGYEPLLNARYGKLAGDMTLSGVLQDFAPFGPDHHMLDVLGCSEVRIAPALFAKAPWPGRLASPRWSQTQAGPLAVTFHNARALPLAWRTSDAYVLGPAGVDALIKGQASVPVPGAAGGGKVASALKTPWDPAEIALLDAGPRPVGLTPGVVTLKRPGFNRLEFVTDGQGPGLVTVSEGYDAGWRAFSDGHERPVRRVDGVLMGVEVPAGRQIVTLAYTPPRWWAGVGLSTWSLLLLALWGLGARSRERKAGLV